jgi:alpha-methylacyl-CoA racemase
MAVGAIEPQFFARLLDGPGLTSEDVPNQLDVAAFP